MKFEITVRGTYFGKELGEEALEDLVDLVGAALYDLDDIEVDVIDAENLKD